MSLTQSEKNFIEEYRRNGGKATEAYQTIRPDIERRSASVIACRMLKRPEVQEALQVKAESESASFGKLKKRRIKEFLEIKDMAIEKERLGTAVQALDKVCNIEGHYLHDDSESDETKYKNFIQKITVNQDNRQVNIQVNEKDDN